MLAVIFALLVPLAIVGGFFLLSMAAFQGASLGGIPQDCPGVSVVVSGEVRSASGQPISGAIVHMQRVPANPESDSQRRFVSEDTGRFASTEAFSIFFCDDLIFDIAHRGEYERQRITYSLADNYTELPAQPIPVRMVVTLIEKLEIIDDP